MWYKLFPTGWFMTLFYPHYTSWYYIPSISQLYTLDMFLQSLSRLRGSSPRWLESWASFVRHLRGMTVMTVLFVHYEWGVKQCQKPPIWKWFLSPFVGGMGDGLLAFYQHTNIIKLLLYDVFWLMMRMMRMMRMMMITIDLVCVCLLLCSYSNNFILWRWHDATSQSFGTPRNMFSWQIFTIYDLLRVGQL